MNGLDFEGRRFKVKVTARSVGTPYLLNGLNISHIWGQGQGQGYGQDEG